MNPVSFLLEVKSEMAKIVWPRRQQAIQLTLLVIVVSAVVGVYIGGLDFIFTEIRLVYSDGLLEVIALTSMTRSLATHRALT